MIKIQKEKFNIDDEIESIRSKNNNIGAVSTFIGYVRSINNNKNVKTIDLEVYQDMALKKLQEITNISIKKWGLIDVLIIHRFGKLKVNDKIVLVATFSEHRKESYEACDFIMNYLKKDAPFWKKEYYKEGYSWLENPI